jgi:hypothetical protein
LLRRYDGNTFAPHAPVFKTGCADAYLEIGAATASNQQAVTGKGHALVVQNIGQAAVGMAGRRTHRQMTAAEVNALAML